MTEEEYRDLHQKFLELDEGFEAVVLYVDKEPGEDEGDAMMRHLIDCGVLSEQDGGLWINEERANAYNPNLYKVLVATLQSEMLAGLDKLIEEGKAFMSVNDNGDIIYVSKDN